MGVYLNSYWNGASKAKPYPTAGLELFYSGIENNQFSDTKTTNKAKILPPCFIGNNIGYYSFGANPVEITENSIIDIDFSIYVGSTSSYIILLGAGLGTASRFYFRLESLVYLYGDGNVLINTFSSDIFTTPKWYNCKLSFNEGVINLIVDGVTHLPAQATPSNFNITFVYIGRSGSARIDNTCKISYLKIGNLYEFYFNNLGIGVNSKLYNTLNSNHINPVSISDANKTYDNGASLYPFTQGYSLWRKDGSEDIQVYYDYSGNPISLTPGVDIPTGYEKIKDIDGSVIYWNMADCLVGYNEEESAATELEVFDRSNTTRQSAISRASDYYDDTDLATKSRYHITEITDPRILVDFFNIGNKAKFFNQIIVEDNIIIGFRKTLIYSTDQLNNLEWKLYKYCGWNIYVILDNGEPTFDTNGYLILE